MVCFQTSNVWGAGVILPLLALTPTSFFFSFFIAICWTLPSEAFFPCGCKKGKGWICCIRATRPTLNIRALLHVHHNTTCKEAHPSGCMHIIIKGVNRSVTTNRPTIYHHIQFLTIMFSCCNVVSFAVNHLSNATLDLILDLTLQPKRLKLYLLFLRALFSFIKNEICCLTWLRYTHI